MLKTKLRLADGLGGMAKALALLSLCVVCTLGSADLLADSAGPPSAGESLVPGEKVDGSRKVYPSFSIEWPSGYYMRSNARKEDDRVIYSVGLQTDTHLTILRIDTAPIGGFASILSDQKVYDIAAGRVRDKMRADFPDLELGAAQSKKIDGAVFHGRKLTGTYKEGGLHAEGKLFLNKRQGLLYIITVMEVSEKPGAKLDQLIATLDTFRFPKAASK